MKKVFFVLAILSVLFITIFPSLVLAQELPLVRCGLDLGSTGEAGECNFCDLINLIRRVFMFIVWIAAPVVTLMLAWAGIQLIIHGSNESKRGEAKQLLKDALFGFLWIILAGALVNLILVMLVKTENRPAGWWWGQSLDCTKTPVDLSIRTAPLPIGVVPTPGSGDYTAIELSRFGLNPGIATVSTGNCKDRTNSSCTSLEGAKGSAINAVNDLDTYCRKADSSCRVTITGFTEVGHTVSDVSHSTGDKFDVSDKNTAFTNYVSGLIKTQNDSSQIQKDKTYRVKLGSGRVVEVRYETGPDHWDFRAI